MNEYHQNIKPRVIKQGGRTRRANQSVLIMQTAGSHRSRGIGYKANHLQGKILRREEKPLPEWGEEERERDGFNSS